MVTLIMLGETATSLPGKVFVKGDNRPPFLQFHHLFLAWLTSEFNIVSAVD